MADDASTLLGGAGGSQEAAFKNFTDNTHTPDDLFTTGGKYHQEVDPIAASQYNIYGTNAENNLSDAAGPSTSQTSWLQRIASSAKKAAGSGVNTRNAEPAGNEGSRFFYSEPYNLLNRGSERVGLEPTKPARPTRPTASENPQEIYRKWWYMMKEFGYKGGK